MKAVEEAFAGHAFRRVVLPGIVATVGVHPLVVSTLRDVGRLYNVSDSVFLLAAEIIVFGLVISSGTTSIYYGYEGFHLRWLGYLPRKINVLRLSRCQQLIESILRGRLFDELSEDEKDRVSVAYQTLLDYPKLGTPNKATFVVDRPTRLGNIIASYERYAETRYGFDGHFYWHHLLLLAPSEARQEFLEQQGFAQSLVVTSFTGAVVALLHLFTIIGLLLGELLDAAGYATASSPISAKTATMLFAAGALIFAVFYLLSLPAHRELGKRYRALVDLYAADLIQWLQAVKFPPCGNVEIAAAALHEYLSGTPDAGWQVTRRRPTRARSCHGPALARRPSRLVTTRIAAARRPQLATRRHRLIRCGRRAASASARGPWPCSLGSSR